MRITTVMLAFFACTSVSAQVLFEDVTQQAGPFHIGESWGAAWGDYNGDNCPDILVNNHRHKNSLWRNNCQGKFHDVMLTFDIDKVFINEVDQDTHGASFADIDNDGDQDIFSTRSSEGSRGQLFINDGGYGDEQGTAWGFDDCRAGRLGSFFDYDNDGFLDAFCSGNGATAVFKRNAGNSFSLDNTAISSTGACRRNNYTQFSNFYTISDGMDLSCSPTGTIPDKLYDMSTTPFTDVTSINSQNISNVSDTIFADFDNDLDADLFALKNATRPSGASRIGSDKIESWLIVDAKQGQTITEKGFRFSASGNVTLEDLEISRVSEANLRFNVFTGASGNNPSAIPVVLDPSDPANQGIIDLQTAGFYIGYDPATQLWTALLRTVTGHQDGYFVIEGSDFSEPVMFNLDNRDLASTPRVHGNNNGTLSPSNGLGLNEPISCGSVAAGDLDNDMDIDLYLACRSGVENLENVIYWNDGDGTFTRGLNHGGEGPVGAGLESGVGSAESVVIGDYDTDGFLDLFVTNGNLLAPQFTGGPDVLIRNLGGNGNHWIELDLVGTVSNRDAIGATVIATAGGKSQFREQNGGYHRWSQDHTRIHFGLAANTSVDITVRWPDGSSDSYTNLAADNLYKVNQGGNAVAATVGPMIDFPAPVPGDECGAPIIDSSSSRALFLYKDCSSGLWRLRAASGNSPQEISYTGTLVSTQAINNVIGFSLESSDILNKPSANDVEFSLTMRLTGQDGFDFELTDGASSCFNVDTPQDVQVFLGDGYHLPKLPLNLETLESCFSLGSSDITVSEADAVATVNVSLLSASTQTITVDYQTLNASATSGSDYTSRSGTLSFNPGDVTKSFNIPIINDTNSETQESFSVRFSNISAGANLATPSITVTIEDDDASVPVNCGEPVIDTAVDRELFIWKDCAGNGDWHVRGTAGGGSYALYRGSIATDQSFSNIVPQSIEPSDILNSSNPQLISFEMIMGNIWTDGFTFAVGQGNNCFSLDLPTGMNVLVGVNRTPVNTPFDLETLGACQSGLSVGDVTVSEADGTASVPVNLSAASTEVVSANFQTVNGTASAGLDYTSASGSVAFSPGQISKLINIDILQDSANEGPEQFSLQLSNVSNALISDNTGLVTINDDEASACGEPAIDPGVDREIFIWRDCSDNSLHLRGYAGGGSVLSYVGNISTTDSFSNIVPISIEPSDVIDTSDSKNIDFNLTMGNIWSDGFKFQVGSGVTCMTLDTPAGQPILVGPGRTPVTSPFDLDTMATCSITGNNAPVLVNPGNQTATVNTGVSLFLSATDVDGDSLVYSATGLPQGLNIDSGTGEISGSATTVGVSNITVTVSDNVDSDNKSFTWTIESPANQAPVADAGADQAIVQPASAALQGGATDDGFPNPPGTLTTTWSKLSGPGTVNFGNTGVLSTSASFSVDGAYVLRLTVSDGQFSDTDDVTISVGPVPNVAPVANAGADQAIVLPASATLQGGATDDGLPNPPGTLTTTWSKVSGPGTVSFGNVSTLNTNASFSIDGTYVLRLTATDGQFSDTDDVTISVGPVPNVAPVANAGVDQTIVLPASVTLAGTATDDGLPNPPGTLTTTWTRFSGPGTVSFANASALNTSASFSVDGTYVLRLTVSDGQFSSTDDVAITVSPVPNAAPFANAGTDQSIELPSSASLQGSASDDGLPNPPATLTTTWSQVSGPGTVSFANASALNTSASFSTDGTYVLRLTANDGQLSDTDDVSITVSPEPMACIDIDFDNGFNGWVNTTSTCSTGTFVNGTPNEVINGNVRTQLSGDHTSGSGRALYTAFNTAAGTDDVDDGECAVRSPDYQITQDAQLSIWYYHGQRDQGDDPSGDYFELEYRINGGSWVDMVRIGDVTINASWTEATANIPAGSTLRIRAKASDGPSTGDLVEAGLDDLLICPQ